MTSEQLHDEVRSLSRALAALAKRVAVLEAGVHQHTMPASTTSNDDGRGFRTDDGRGCRTAVRFP
jgi:hypothetical protein